MNLRENPSSTTEAKLLDALREKRAGSYIAEGMGTGLTNALAFVGDRKNRIGQQALGVGQGLTGEYKRRIDASPEFTDVNIRGNTGQLPSGDSRLQDLATYNLPGTSLETLGTMMLLTEEQATDLAKTIGLQGARLANTVMQATKTPQGTGQLVSDTISWIKENAPENLEEAQEALWKFGESLTAGDVTGLGSVAMAPIKKGLKKTLKDADESLPIAQAFQGALSVAEEKARKVSLEDIKKKMIDVRNAPDSKTAQKLNGQKNKLIEEHVTEYGYGDFDRDEVIDLMRTGTDRFKALSSDFGIGKASRISESKRSKKLDDGTKVDANIIVGEDRGLLNPAVREREAGRGNVELLGDSYDKPFTPEFDIVDEDITRRIINPSELEGKVLIPFAGDRSRVGLLRRIGQTEFDSPIDIQGGPDFPGSELARKQGAVWASMGGVLQRKYDQAKRIADAGFEPVGVYSAMHQSAVNFSTPVIETIIESMAKSGTKISQRALEGASDTINSSIRQKNKKDLSDWEKKVKNAKKNNTSLPEKPEPTPEFVGLTNPDMYHQLMGIGNYPREGSGALRKSVIEILQQGQWQELGFPNVRDILTVVNDPDLYNINRADVGASFFDIDTTKPIFKPTGEGNVHRSYDSMISGEDIGKTERPDIPSQVAFPDMYDEARLRKTSPKSGDPKPLDISEQTGHAQMRGDVGQLMTPQVVDSWSRWIERSKEKGIPIGAEMPLALALIAIVAAEGETE